jgi:hypothetical protein
LDDARDHPPSAEEAITSSVIVSPSPGKYKNFLKSFSDDNLVSTRLKETDAVETVRYTSMLDDPRDHPPQAEEAITSSEIVFPCPGKYDDLLESFSDGSSSMRISDRYASVDLPPASVEEVRDLPSDSIDAQLEKYSSNTKSLPMVRRVSFSQESHQVLEFEVEDSVNSFVPNDLGVGNQPGEGVFISPEKVSNQSLGGVVNSYSLADSLEDVSVKEATLSDPTPTAGLTTTATSTGRVVVEESTVVHPDLSGDKMDTNSENAAASIAGKIRELATKGSKKCFRLLGLKKRVKKNTASATPKPTTTLKETTTPKTSTNPKPSITEEVTDTPDTMPVAVPDPAPICCISEAAATVVAALWTDACLALPMYCATAEPFHEDNDSISELEENQNVITDDTPTEESKSVITEDTPSTEDIKQNSTPTSEKRRVRQSSIMPRNSSTNEEDEEASFFGGSVRMLRFLCSTLIDYIT